MSLVLNWLLVLVFAAAFLCALYIVIRMAVRDGLKEGFHEVGSGLAKLLWAEDKKENQSADRDGEQ